MNKGYILKTDEVIVMEDPRQPLVLRKWDEDTSFEFRGPDNPRSM